MVLRSFTLALAVGAAGLVGCTARPSGDSPRTPDAAAASPSSEKETEGLALLDSADLSLAQRQRSCPVSKELLGSMGKPVRLLVEGRTFFLCCKGCKETVDTEPATVLAQVDRLLGKPAATTKP